MTAFRTLDYLKYRGGWDLSTTYVTNDAVTFGSIAYIALGKNSNSQPPSSDWAILAQGTPGTPGAPGAPGVNWRGAWSSIIAYAQGDGVTYSGQSYLAITSTTNNQPDTSPTQWLVFTGAPATPVPIGTVIDWWRPSNVVPVPAGFAIPTGQTLTSSQHAFLGVAGSIILPDLRNRMILGADVAKFDGTAASSATDGVAGAPGIGGSGGSNFRDLTHSHTADIGAVTSSLGGAVSQPTGFGGADTVSTSSAGGSTDTTTNATTSQNISGAGGPLSAAGYPHTHNVTIPAHTHNVATNNHTHGMSIAAHAHTIDPPSVNTSGGLGVFDVHPQYIGMLKLMRVQ